MPSLLIREKVQDKTDPTKTLWQFRTIEEGPGIRTGKLQGPFYTRPFVNGRQLAPKRLKAATFAEAKDEAAELPDKVRAQEAGVSVPEIRSNRVLIKTAVANYMAQIEGKPHKTIAQYSNALNQFMQAVKVKFLDQIDVEELRNFKKWMVTEGYAGKTQYTRLNIVYFLLNDNGMTVRLPKKEKPVFEEEPAEVYPEEMLKKLFAVDKNGHPSAMSDTETVQGKPYSGSGFGTFTRFKFFLGSGCRDKEVEFAAWDDINFDRKEYTVRSKKDVGFTVKNHESRTIPLPDSLIQLLKTRKENAPSSRWVFTNQKSEPGNNFLDKLKRIAKNAGLNCGHCKHTITKGRYTKRQVEVTCVTDPVCDQFILHRFRKTCATRWLEAGVGVRTIQHFLGHKDLKTTMRYLGVEDTQAPEHRAKINDAFGD